MAAFDEFYRDDSYFHLCADFYGKSLDATMAQFDEDSYWAERGQHGERLYQEYLQGELGAGDLVFDFGCGDGAWLWGLQQLTGCAVGGEEISSVYVKVASKQLGVPIFEGGIEATAEAIVAKHRNAAKLAIVSGSLQHMLDPMLCLRAARDILVEGGLLYICNWSIFDHFMRPWADQPGRLLGEVLSWEHLHYFHETAFRHMVEVAGFEIIAFSPESRVRPRHMEILARKSERSTALPSVQAVTAVAMRIHALESANTLRRLRSSS